MTYTGEPKRTRQVLVLLLACSVFVSACASQRGSGAEATQTSTAGGSPMTADEEQLRKEANTFNTTVVEGSLLGAGLGILAGVLIGATTGRVENMVKYGAVGGVTGGVLGGVDGYMVAKRQESGNNRIRMIQSMTRDVEADNEKLHALVESSNRILADSKRQLADINQQVETKTADLAEARATRSRVEQNRNVMQASLDGLKKRRDTYHKAAAQTGGDTRDLDAQIQRLDQQIAELEQNVLAMNQALAVSKV
jgi:predicted small secreted protein